MKTLIVIALCIALVGVELLGVAVLVAPGAVWRVLRSAARNAGNRATAFADSARESMRRVLGGRGPWLRPPRLTGAS